MATPDFVIFFSDELLVGEKVEASESRRNRVRQKRFAHRCVSSIWARWSVCKHDRFCGANHAPAVWDGRCVSRRAFADEKQRQSSEEFEAKAF